MAHKKLKEVWYTNSGYEADSEGQALWMDLDDALEAGFYDSKPAKDAVDALHEYYHRNDPKPEPAPQPAPKLKLPLQVGLRYRLNNDEVVEINFYDANDNTYQDSEGFWYSSNGCKLLCDRIIEGPLPWT